MAPRVLGVSGSEYQRFTTYADAKAYVDTDPSGSGNLPTVSPKWYVVFIGREPEDTGVYSSWAAVAQRVLGVSGAIYQGGFKAESEANHYLQGLLHGQGAAPAPPSGLAGLPPYTTPGSSHWVPPTAVPPRPTVSSFAGGPPIASTGAANAPTGPYGGYLTSVTPANAVPTPTAPGQPYPPSAAPPGVVPPFGANPSTYQGQYPPLTPPPVSYNPYRFFGPGPLIGKHNELYKLNAGEDWQILHAFSPPGLSPEQQGRLAMQTLDITGLPGTYGKGIDDSQMERMVTGIQMLAAGTVNSHHNHLGGQTDTGWKLEKRVSLSSIKSVADLGQRARSISSNSHQIQVQVVTGLKAVLTSCGYPVDVAEQMAHHSGYLKVSQAGITAYQGLHLYLYELGLEKGWEYVQRELNHHLEKLLTIRAIYSTWLQVILHSYCYLRNSEASKWQSVSIQGLHLRELEKGASSVGSDLTADVTESTASVKFCKHCRTSLHLGDKNSCPFGEVSATQARAKAREAIRTMAGM